MAGELNSLVTRWLKQVLMSVWSPTECGRVLKFRGLVRWLNKVLTVNSTVSVRSRTECGWVRRACAGCWRG
eukprot:337806-Prorocentrum_minimum.AAC.2